MKLRIPSPLLATFALLIITSKLAAQPAIIPCPQLLELRPGVFKMRSEERATRIVAGPACEETGRYLADQLRRLSGTDFRVIPISRSKADTGDLLITTNEARSDLGEEGYELTVAPDQVMIRARNPAGTFYGLQTLLQLLPARATKAAAGGQWEIPCVSIKDQPRFPWRGLMLDVSRHFFTKDEVKQLLDAMALYKMNTFHWHLVDDQGWRIEIKKYPRLTEVGAWRKGIGFGLDPKSTTAYGPDGRYGGFYTQSDIREVVAYAAARHITIVPEIEMPGHSSAALMAYPEYSCTGGPFTTDLPGGVFDGVYCAANDGTFTFVQDVLTEVFALFPGKYVHIGGDEVLTTNWMNCAKCQALMKQEGFKKEIELESYFIRRVDKFVNAKGRNLIGWSEIRQGGLAANATIMDWVGGAMEAASAGHDVVMSPLADCYFDHYQSEDHSTEPHAIGGYLPLTQVYNFELLPAKLPPQFQTHILGAQGNVWTEYMPSFQHVEYMVFPRLCALSEVVWSPKSSRNWSDFEQRLQEHYARLEALGINYRHPVKAPMQINSGK